MVGHVTEETSYKTFTSDVAGKTALSIQGDAEETGDYSQAWRITTGDGDDSLEGGFGDNSTIDAGNGNNYVDTHAQRWLHPHGAACFERREHVSAHGWHMDVQCFHEELGTGLRFRRSR